MISRLSLAVVFVVVLTGCASSGAPTQSAQPQSNVAPSAPSAPKTATVAVNEDPGSLWDGITGGGGGGTRELGHLVNQYVVALQADASPQPRLLAELPSFEQGTWTVAPDGEMEVTWKLRPGVTWHDGVPFTADDVIFSWQVNRDPDVPNGNQAAVKLIKSVEARDPLTVVSTWSKPYPFADRLEHRELFPLPRHLLERPYSEAKDQLLIQPYFSSEYVGTGPFRIERWERGSSLDLVAFDNYFLGRPKLDRIRVMFIADENTALANLEAGTLNTFLPSGGPTFDQLVPLRQGWEASKRGTILNESVRWFFAEPQKAPARNPQPAALLDPRVREALLLAIDRQDLTRAIFGDQGIVADSWVHPSFSYYPQIQDALSRYPYEPRRAAAMLSELGWRPVADGVLENNGERFNVQVRYRDNEKEATVLRDAWKQIGVNGTIEFLPEHQLRDRAARAQFTGFDLSSNPMGGLSAVRRLIGEAAPTPENRWTGTNRGGYANPAWDEIGQRMRVTLEESRRIEQERDLVRIFSSDLPLLPIYFEIQAVPVGHGLTGVQPIRGIAHTGHVMHTWNVHEWTLTN